MNLLEQLKVDEDFSSTVYPCPAGKLTIGYGRNVDPDGGGGITEDEALMLLANDIAEVKADLARIFPDWREIDAARQNALANMRFQMGAGSFRTFRNMIKAVLRKDWHKACLEALDSKWAREDTPPRAARVASEIRRGSEDGD